MDKRDNNASFHGDSDHSSDDVIDRRGTSFSPTKKIEEIRD
jgi:hypothetical protein